MPNGITVVQTALREPAVKWEHCARNTVYMLTLFVCVSESISCTPLGGKESSCDGSAHFNSSTSREINSAMCNVG